MSSGNSIYDYEKLYREALARAKKAEAQIAVLVDGCGFDSYDDENFTYYCSSCAAGESEEHSYACIFKNLPSEATKLLEKLKQYEKALEFYAAEKNWVGWVPEAEPEIFKDNGKRARYYRERLKEEVK